MTERNEALQRYLEANPRKMGVLFAVCLLLAQAGNASAAFGGTIGGP